MCNWWENDQIVKKFPTSVLVALPTCLEGHCWYNQCRSCFIKGWHSFQLMAYTSCTKEKPINLRNTTVTTLRIRLQNDLYCVGWGVKLYSLTHSLTTTLSGMCNLNCDPNTECFNVCNFLVLKTVNAIVIFQLQYSLHTTGTKVRLHNVQNTVNVWCVLRCSPRRPISMRQHGDRVLRPAGSTPKEVTDNR